ncbi:Bromodomain-containing protein, partial [Rhizopogon salebrosus TDB-379]
MRAFAGLKPLLIHFTSPLPLPMLTAPYPRGWRPAADGKGVNPMDLGTIECKLMSSNPSKPDPNPNNPRYYSAEEFVSDVRLVFSNCITFNGPDHMIAQAGKHVESVFDKQIKQLPPPAEAKATVVKKLAMPPPTPTPPAPAEKASVAPVRCPSTSVPVIRLNEAERVSVRPKLKQTAPPTPMGTNISTISSSQHRFCLSTIRSLKKLKDASVFLRPVNPVSLNIPHYPSIIKNPMDLGTIECKLMSSNPSKPDPNPNNPRYYSTEEFVSDVRLVFSNCITFNGPDHMIAQAAKHVESIFDKQIKQLPPPAEAKATVVKKLATPPPPPPTPPAPAKKASVAPVRRPSTSVPVIRRNEAERVSVRPK